MASGDNAKAAGEGGVVADAIHGDVMTGKQARKVSAGTYIERQQVDNRSVFNQSGQTVHGNQVNMPGSVNTGGALFNLGDINTGGGDFVGRDKIVQGDKVRGDKVAGDKIRIGNVSGGNLAVGRDAQVHANTNPSAANILRALQPILLAAQAAPADKRAEVVEKAEQLKAEVEKGKEANDKVIGGLGPVDICSDDCRYPRATRLANCFCTVTVTTGRGEMSTQPTPKPDQPDSGRSERHRRCLWSTDPGRHCRAGDRVCTRAD